MTAPTDRPARPDADPYHHPTTTHPISSQGGQAPAAAKEPRTVRVRLAAIVATVAFVLGLGVSMILGPIMGGPPSGQGPGGQGGQGPGAPSTSQTTQGTTQGATQNSTGS